MLRSNTAHLYSEEKSAEAPPKQRPRLCGQALHNPTNTKKEKSSRTSLLVPYDVLFSNSFLEDLAKIWALRYIIPDPDNYIS